MAETPHFGLTAPDGVDPIDVPLHLLELAEQIEELLQGFPVAELGTAGVGDAGKLLVVKNTGDAAWAAMSGDATLNHEGKIAIANLAVSTGKLAELAVTATKIAAEAIETGKIKNLAVTGAKISAEAVSAAKILEEAVTNVKLGALSVSTEKIQNLAVTAAKLAAEAVETGKIQNLAVTAAKLAAAAVEEAKIADGAVTSRKFKPTLGQISQSAKLTLTEAYQDVPGTELKLTPAVASKILVVAMFDFNTASAGQSFGVLNVDGVDQANFAGGFQPTTTAMNHVQSWVVALTAAAHTLKLRAKKGSGTIHCEAGQTGFFYMLAAS